MSTEIAIIPRTGTEDLPLHITQFCGPTKKGMMLQLAQDDKEMYYSRCIQLTRHDAWQLMIQLAYFAYQTERGEDDSLSTP
jgi:hypothetical protein